MNFLLDTCTISEPKQKQPNQRVLEWLDEQDEAQLYLSVLTIGEIKKPIARLESSRKKIALESWLEALRARFSRRVLPLTEKTFLVWGKMCGDLERAGVLRPTFDSLLEATALEHDLVFVTRNTKNFQNSSVTILDPWQD